MISNTTETPRVLSLKLWKYIFPSGVAATVEEQYLDQKLTGSIGLRSHVPNGLNVEWDINYFINNF